MTRLNKFITDAGYCSRRDADAYIEQGRVTVNGRDAKLGTTVEVGDVVEVDGERVGKKPKAHVYIALNKPVGITCTTDRDDKTNIIDFLNYKERIFPVGRLDKDSNGLIILTNNGDIVNKILRAGNNNPKEYVVTVNKAVTNDFVDAMKSGVRILGVKTKPCEVIMRNSTTFTIFLTQGLNRQIRRMCAELGYTVTTLKRVRVMNITLGALEVGKWRYFTPQEIADMQTLLEASSGTEEASKIKRSTSQYAKAKANSVPKGRVADGQRAQVEHNPKGKPSRGERKAVTNATADFYAEGGRSGGTRAGSSRSSSGKRSGTYNDFRRRSKSR